MLKEHSLWKGEGDVVWNDGCSELPCLDFSETSGVLRAIGHRESMRRPLSRGNIQADV